MEYADYVALADSNLVLSFQATEDSSATYFARIAQVYATLAVAAAQTRANQITIDASRGGIVRD